jgi:hypothetical protein
MAVIPRWPGGRLRSTFLTRRGPLPKVGSAPRLAIAEVFEQGMGMRRLKCWSIAVGAIWALLPALSGSALAMTCSERLQVCHGYCVKSMGDSPGCHAKCRQFHQECMASGCWESKVVAKQCGFARQ